MKILRRLAPKIALAILGLLVLFGLVEGLIRLTGLFRSPRPLEKVRHNSEIFFTVNPEFARGLSRDGGPPAVPPVWVTAQKPDGIRRVVLLGGSAAAGFPMTDYHLGRIIEARWRARFPGEPIEVVNLSMEGADSGTLREFADSAMALDPDMIVVCAEDNASPGNEDGLRGMVRTALAHETKVLFALPASNRGDQRVAENNLRALQQKIASESGPAVVAVDAGQWLGGQNLPAEAADTLFIDGTNLSFAGRVALAELTVDGMAGLWGIAPRDEGAEEVAAWWKKFPQAESEARRDTFFTAYDEHDMWSLIMKQVADPARRAGLEARVSDLRRRAAIGWDTTDILVAYERAQLQNPRDALAHFTAGRLLGSRGEGERAVEAFQRGFALQPHNTDALLNYAAMQMTRGDTESARASLDALEKYDPQSEGLLKMRAAVALREAELPEAAGLLEKHLARNPGDADSWLTLSEIQLKLGDFPASEASRQKGKGAAGQ